jgi:hypothetical protein
LVGRGNSDQKGGHMSRRDRRLQQVLIEKVGRRQYVEPLLEPGETVEWEIGFRGFGVTGGRSTPIQAGFVVLTDRRIIFVPKDGPPAAWRPNDDVTEAEIVRRRWGMARFRLTLRSGEMWTLSTGEQSADYITKFATGVPFSY